MASPNRTVPSAFVSRACKVDTRCYVARTSVDKLVDWCLNTPEDGLTKRRRLDQRLASFDAIS